MNEVLERHGKVVVHALADGFHRQEGAAQHVGAARAGADAGHTRLTRVGQRGVARVDAVDAARSCGVQMSFISL